MLLFAGLGNPGAKYANNRHNVGFMAADAIARRHSFSPWSRKFQAEIAEGRIGGEKVLLLKPQTFMNLSGQAVGEALRFYKLDPSAVTVFYDEIDLAAGKLRVKVGGGSGGHNGIRSLDQHIGNSYRRVRIGVGHPGVKEMVHGHVLGDFSKADREWLDVLLDAVADGADLLARGDDSGFMNRVTLTLRDKLRPTGDDDTPPPKQKPARGDDSGFMNRVTLTLRDKLRPTGDDDTPPPKQKPARAQSHVRQARPQQPAVKVPEAGPMAAMLKKLLGKE